MKQMPQQNAKWFNQIFNCVSHLLVAEGVKFELNYLLEFNDALDPFFGIGHLQESNFVFIPLKKCQDLGLTQVIVAHLNLALSI